MQRSIPGTIVSAIVAAAHSVSVVFVIEQLLDYYYFDWVHVLAQLLQVGVFVSLLVALFKPLRKTAHRLIIAALCFASFIMNMFAFAWGYWDYDTERLILLWLVFIDLVPAAAFMVPPSHVVARLAPYYGDDEGDSGGASTNNDINDVAPPPPA